MIALAMIHPIFSRSEERLQGTDKAEDRVYSSAQFCQDALRTRICPQESSVEEALWGTRVSPSTVSDLNQQIYGRIEAWRNRPIQGEHPYVFLDGLRLKRSWGGEVQNVSVLVAIRVGHRTIPIGR
jgi:hypothetical protein